MATFTIDLLSGKVFLFVPDIGSGSGTTGTTSGSTYPEVATYSALPSPASAYNGKTYLVRESEGDYVLNRKEAGLYQSNGESVWHRLGDIPSFFKSNNFQIYDSVDNTKGFEFITSGITGNTFRQLTVQDINGTIALLTDVGVKLDTSIFNNYTGITETTLSGINNDSGSTQIISGVSFNRTVVSGVTTYSPSKNDTIIGIYTNNNPVEIILPIISNVGEVYWTFKDEGFNAASNHITFTTSGTDVIENNLTEVEVIANGGSISIYNNNSNNWFII